MPSDAERKVFVRNESRKNVRKTVVMNYERTTWCAKNEFPRRREAGPAGKLNRNYKDLYKKGRSAHVNVKF